VFAVVFEEEPVVGGIGVGLRTTILGYFVRFDVAWGIEDYRINKSLSCISLSIWTFSACL